MINAKELRIGNLVYEDETIHEWNIYDYTLNQEFYSPIPLTPEILIACGFQKFDDENVREQFVAKDFNGHNWLWLEQNHGEVYGNYWPSNVDTEGYTAFSLVPITSLHQLQNLCFALTGEEITYTPLPQTTPSGSNTVQNTDEDGSLCWWSNVSIKHYPKAKEFPSWRWSDRQYEFYNRWRRSTKKNNDYFTIPIHPVFHDDGSVTLGTRPHAFVRAIDEEDYRPTKTFPNWKKVTSKEMSEFYQHAVSSKPKKEKLQSVTNTEEK